MEIITDWLSSCPGELRLEPVRTEEKVLPWLAVQMELGSSRDHPMRGLVVKQITAPSSVVHPPTQAFSLDLQPGRQLSCILGVTEGGNAKPCFP